MTIEKKIKTLLDDFSNVSDDKERLELIMEFGEEVEKPKIQFSLNERVPGCASEVFVRTRIDNDKVFFDMWSTSLIIKGYCKLLQNIFNGEEKETILNSQVIITNFIKASGLDASLIPSRTNSFERLYTFILDAVKKL